MSTENTGGHEVPLSPPPAAPSAPFVVTAPPADPGRGAGAGRPIGIVLGLIGGVALAVSGATAAVAAAGQLSQTDSSTSLGVAGIDGLVLDVDASDVTVEFADIAQAELTVQGGRSRAWSLERDGDDLVVNSPNRGFGWWFGGWFGDEERVVLTLPQSLRGIDADIDLNAGSLDATGEFGEMEVVVGAGALSLDGSAESVEIEVNAGRADLDLFAVREADLTISAGRLTAEFANTAPDLVTFEVSAGSLELTLPDEAYDLRQEVSAGSLDNGLQTSSDSRHVIEATVSAGSAILRAED